MKTPTVRQVTANGLSYRVLEWSPAAPKVEGVALLLHGFMDAGSTWDLVVPALLAANLRVFAPDLRGFGEGARVSAGAYYHFPDYVFDVADLVDALSDSLPLYVIGHSMGGTIAALYAGSFPERVTKLALLEGAGPPDNPPEIAPTRMRRWIEEVRVVRAKNGTPRAIGTRENALQRLKGNHPGIDSAILQDRVPHLVRAVGENEVTWANDPLHKTMSPMPFFSTFFMAFAKQVTCPVLFVGGGPTGYHPPDEDERLRAFKSVTRAEIADAGHMMHWTKPAELGRILVEFWKG